MKRPLIIFASCVGALVAVQNARAAGNTPASHAQADVDARAREAARKKSYEAGLAFVDVAERTHDKSLYEKALVEFENARGGANDVKALWNLAVTEVELERWADALAHLQEFDRTQHVAGNPKHQFYADYTEYVTKASAALARAREAAAHAAVAAPVTRPPETSTGAQVPPPIVAKNTVVDPFPARKEAPEKDDSSSARPWVVGTLGVTSGVLAVGTIVAIGVTVSDGNAINRAKSESPNCSFATTCGPVTQAMRTQEHAAYTWYGLGIGTAAFAAGAVLTQVLWPATDRDSASARAFTPAVGPTFVGGAYSVRF